MTLHLIQANGDPSIPVRAQKIGILAIHPAIHGGVGFSVTHIATTAQVARYETLAAARTAAALLARQPELFAQTKLDHYKRRVLAPLTDLLAIRAALPEAGRLWPPLTEVVVEI
jgi:hypothetical protein